MPDHRSRSGESVEARFVSHLMGLVSGQRRGVLAALRRGLGRDVPSAEQHRVVAPWLRTDASVRDARPWYLIASLFAAHPVTAKVGEGRHHRSFGVSMAELNRHREGHGVERRFMALLDADEEDLASHLRHAVQLLRTADVAVDWEQLLLDLRWWSRGDEAVQQRWAKDFWAGHLSDSQPLKETNQDVDEQKVADHED
jgi:CRISPR system Cascade subunit CasB